MVLICSHFLKVRYITWINSQTIFRNFLIKLCVYIDIYICVGGDRWWWHSG
jgi:hypothetical protein